MQRVLYYIILLLAAHSVSAQSVTGSWYGKADVEMAGLHSNYLTELVIKQKGNRVEGIFGYYFRDKYQSFFVHGKYDPKTRQVIIENIPVIYYKSNSTVNSIDCNTSFIGTIVRSKVQSTLKGAFYHDERYKYTCPDLKVSYTLDREDKETDSTLQAMASSVGASKVWKPQVDDIIVDAMKNAVAASGPAAPKGNEAASVQATQPVKSAQADSMDLPVSIGKPAILDTVTSTLAKTTTAITAPVAAAIDPVIADNKLIAESFSKRKTVLTRTIDVESDSVRLSFYDNGEIDGDSISVFVNNQVVLTHKELESKALTLYLKLDSTREVNDLSMFAENLGKYPPNTALMVITDGTNRYEVYMSSSLTENATIQIRRKKKELPDPHRL